MKKAKSLVIKPKDKEYLLKLIRSGMTPKIIAQRANILLEKEKGLTNDEAAEALGLNRRTVMLWVNKYKNRKEDDLLEDLLNVAEGRGRKEQIVGEAKTWLISVACSKPKDLGLAAETWTTTALTKYIREHAEEAGFERLSTISESGVYKILDKSKIKPFRIQYYCERRDPEFNMKMHNVLLVYKQLEIQFDEDGNLIPWEEDEQTVHVLSYDEKPGIQALSTTAEDLMPTEENGCIKRDYEYKRLGTLSLLAGIDLQTGEGIPLVRETHTSEDFIDFLKILDKKYPTGDKIRLILDNLRVHSSEQVKAYIQSNPDRFEFVFTPKHASWLNLVESFFSKMTKQMLRGITVKSKKELEERIYLYFEEINADPVVYHWSWKLDDIDITEKVEVETFSKSVANL